MIMSDQIFDIVVETFIPKRSNSKQTIRVRPVSGQGYPIEMYVSCSTTMRNSVAVGTKIKLPVKVAIGRDGTEYLYANPRAQYEIVE